MSPQPSLIHHGGLPFLVAAIIGRMPAAIVQLGLLMYVSGVGLGLELGGLTVAAVGVGTALGATIIGRFVDAIGPLPVVLGATIWQACALYVIHLITPGLVHGTISHWVLLLVAAACGFANPQVGPIVRSHWSHLSRQRNEPRLVRKALGYEGAMDEMSFIVGPILASLLVALLGPTRAILTLIGIIVVGQGIFIAYLFFDRQQWRHPSAGPRQASSTSIPFGVLLAPMLVLLGVGISFGATQTALTAVHAAHGTPHLTGIIYGSVGIGSAMSSLLSPRIPARVTTGTRLLFGAFGVLFGGVAFSFLPGLAWSLVVAVLAGVGIGVVLVTGFARAEEVAPSSRIASVMTMLAMCLTLGVSIGAAIAGQLTDDLSRGFWPVIGAGLLAMVGALLVMLSQRRADAR